MELKVELRQMVGERDTALGVMSFPQAIDGIYVNGLLSGFIDRRANAGIYGLRPNIPTAAWPTIAAKVKELRPDADISKVSGVTAEEAALAQQLDDEEEEEGDGDE